MEATKQLCQICHEKEADAEGVVCSQCKSKADQDNFEEELRAYEEDMLQYCHFGETCWLSGYICRDLGWCCKCEDYINWKRKRDEDRSQPITPS